MDQAVFAVQLARTAVAGLYTIFLYEFSLLLDREYRTIYKSRWSPTKLLYLTCRFLPLIAGPFYLGAYMFDHDLETCQRFLFILSTLDVILTCVPHCIYTLRAWAFTGATRLSLLIYLPCLFAYCFVIAWHQLYGVILPTGLFQVLGKTACLKTYADTKVNYYRRMLAATISLDSIVGLTVAIHCYRIRGPQTRLSRLLVTQGLLYYPLMFSLNIGALIVEAVGSFRGYDILAFAAVFAVSNVMACRFVIQIREYVSASSSTNEILSRVGRELECAFPTDISSSGPQSEPLELSSILIPRGSHSRLNPEDN